jgi:hypothetical protein
LAALRSSSLDRRSVISALPRCPLDVFAVGVKRLVLSPPLHQREWRAGLEGPPFAWQVLVALLMYFAAP